MNSFQSMPQWENYFGTPTGGKLGILNAIQVSSGLARRVIQATKSLLRTLAPWRVILSLRIYRMAWDGEQPSGLVRLSCWSESGFRLPRTI